MSFRRSDDTGPASARWLSQNRGALVAAGIPSSVVDQHRSWNYVLLHGDDELQSGWHAEWLTPTQARDVLALIATDLDNEAELELIPRLRVIASRHDCQSDSSSRVTPKLFLRQSLLR
ncbi:hypothetical protein N9Y42_07890 [Mariniblastus sp.]|nr:hypothetical protein [Mariniblastus sp.]